MCLSGSDSLGESNNLFIERTRYFECPTSGQVDLIDQTYLVSGMFNPNMPNRITLLELREYPGDDNF
jgi:hypothetical protein